MYVELLDQNDKVSGRISLDSSGKVVFEGIAHKLAHLRVVDLGAERPKMITSDAGEPWVRNALQLMGSYGRGRLVEE